MKILGYYIFEDSPELKAYRLELGAYRQYEIDKRRKENMRDCKGKSEDDFLPPPPDFHNAKAAIDWHNNEKKQGLCHFFAGKKYCYHTGKEIIFEGR